MTAAAVRIFLFPIILHVPDGITDDANDYAICNKIISSVTEDCAAETTCIIMLYGQTRNLVLKKKKKTTTK